MPDPMIVLVVVLARDARDVSSQSVASAAKRTLGESALVLVQETDTRLSDDAALALARNVRAAAVAEVLWSGRASSQARLHMYLPERGVWYDRDFAFAPQDAPSERGRAIGLTLGVALGGRPVADEPTEPLNADDASPSEPPPSAPPVPAPVAPAQGPPPAAAPTSPVIPEAPRREPPSFRLDLSGSGSVGLGGSALGAGPAAAVRWLATAALALRAAGFARVGELPALGASSDVLGLGGGVAWTAWKRASFEVGARTDLVALEHVVVRDADGVRRRRWLTAAQPLLEAAWFPTERIGLAAALGMELAFGPTEIRVGGTETAQIPVARALGELGVRARF